MSTSSQPGNFLHSDPTETTPGQVVDLYDEMRALDRFLIDKGRTPEQQYIKYKFDKPAAPLFMPDFIQRYLDVGMSLNSVSIAVDASDAGVYFGAEITCGPKDKLIVFTIVPDESGSFEVKKTSGDLAEELAVDPEDINRMITEMSFSLHHRHTLEVARELDTIPIYPDLTNPVTGRLVMQCLEVNADNISPTNHFILEGEGETNSMEFVVSYSEEQTTYRIESSFSRDDDIADRKLAYSIELDKVVNPDTPDRMYILHVEAQRFVKNGDRDDFVEFPKPDDASVVEHAIATLKQLRGNSTNSVSLAASNEILLELEG